ncbi:S8 family serine peptidase [Xanthomonas hortorum]|uniref:S8 family serine peptidase n=1 Tax=Xanthomonas hortorum pv. vitians TaxID=83224 RepID=A0A6V7E5D8_9XANT|nr:S8 family serine peptidase [Xanthomonas hortorum]APP84860.1 autotransporter outer membrane beta-barrel domain-containing protein [Xanthomonas hortorum pv. gardneri]MCC8495930.1 S8 family serine peptidase [Xanthomonas hortorum pv. gardneri]MCE4281655.1 S8 family serine peptidase [Xanthomonas hortorum pv. vitians]MCE4286489.1 S8 family serine peptidase [Xanthomonas hortorum pv. vitians]MCE4291079.1 S8 family serine peptidase [Xanthomonas hortorum pv. vitians]
MNRSLLATTIASCLVLTACGGGGGGGNVRSDPPQTTVVAPTPSTPAPTTPTTPAPTPTPMPTAPATPTPPTTPAPPETSTADPLPKTAPAPTPAPSPAPAPARYQGLGSNLLVPTNADLAQQAGARGQGVKLAVLDDNLVPSYAPINGKVDSFNDYTASPGTPESSANALRGHGTVISALVLGSAQDGFAGGIAPDADLFYARICAENSCGTQQARRAAVDLAAAGVRIANLSIGASYADAASSANAALAWKFALAPLVQADALIVASTGNEGASEASYPAATPVQEASLRNNWLAVGAINIDSAGNAAGLTSYSNHCGAAAQWCLVAPGSYFAPALAGTELQGQIAGTSFSTAAVTGVAAQVLGVYPWMSASNLQQTLLTTATDLGDPGVDALYGYGLVNAAKAINGPAQFVNNWSANVTSGYDSTFSNDISGAGNLTKNGAGKLTLSGNNTYTGGTSVSDGVLALSGSLRSDVIVLNSATFESHGGVINGNYSLVNNTGTTALELGKGLTVTGQASLKGNLLLLPEAAGYTVGSSEKIVQAGNLQGTFDRVQYANNFFWTASLAYDPTTVTATLTRNASAASAQAAGAPQSVVNGAAQADTLVKVLDTRVASGDTDNLGGLISATGSLLAATDAQVAASLPTLAGQVHGIERTLGFQSALNDARVAADRLPYLADTTTLTTWMQGSYLDGNLGGNGFDSADYTQQSTTFGVDLPVGSAGTVVGAAVSSGQDRANIDASASRLRSDRYAMTAYLYQPIGQAYLSGIGSYGMSNVETERSVQAGSIGERLQDRRHDTNWSLRAELGLLPHAGLSPFVAVGVVSQKQDAFSEASATGLGLSANSDTLRAGYGEVGVRGHLTRGKWGFDGLVAYRSLFGNPNSDFTAWFTDLPEARFNVAGEPVSKQALRASVGVRYQLNDAFSIYGNVGAERGRSDANSINANVGLRWQF